MLQTFAPLTGPFFSGDLLQNGGITILSSGVTAGGGNVTLGMGEQFLANGGNISVTGVTVQVGAGGTTQPTIQANAGNITISASGSFSDSGMNSYVAYTLVSSPGVALYGSISISSKANLSLTSDNLQALSSLTLASGTTGTAMLNIKRDPISALKQLPQ